MTGFDCPHDPFMLNHDHHVRWCTECGDVLATWNEDEQEWQE